jgi:Calcium-dependent channel, 7TM region, putative phosphate
MFPFRLLQFGSLFVYPFARVGCKTPRDFQELKTPPTFSFGMFLPQPILVLILCLSYSVMKPLILIAGLFYFCIGYFVYKYQLLYCFPPTEMALMDSNGLPAPQHRWSLDHDHPTHHRWHGLLPNRHDRPPIPPKSLDPLNPNPPPPNPHSLPPPMEH